MEVAVFIDCDRLFFADVDLGYRTILQVYTDAAIG
ncbi:hypothetical protein EVA_13580 [gut metagenome]|uniref:Uncharacterized protein n=1 Tax=gut metagenome TaxID=749906 RepID=J9GG40_9ZZZZ